MAGLAIGSSGLLKPEIARADDAWSVDRDGVWDDPANWQVGTVPDGIGVRALFGPVITAPRTITVQDLPGGQGNGDNRITLGELSFDSAISYTLRNASNQRPQIELDSLTGPAFLRVLSEHGHAAQTVSPTVELTSRDEVVFDIQAIGGLSIPSLRASGLTARKLGPGRLTLGIGVGGARTWVVEEGTLVDVDSGEILLNGGALEGAYDRHTTVGDRGGRIRSANFVSDDRLRGESRLDKVWSGQFVVSGIQPEFRGPLIVHEGSVTFASAATNPLPAVQSIGVRGNAGFTQARLELGSHDYSGTQIFVGSGAQLVGPSDGALGFASLTRGENLTLAEGAVLAQTNDGANQAVANLGTNADLFFGVGAELALLDLTVGAGTPWRGISGPSRIAQGVFRANSDFTIQAPLILGSAAEGAPVSILSTGERRTVTIEPPAVGVRPLGDDGFMPSLLIEGDNPNYSGVGRLIVSSGATLDLAARGIFGQESTKIPAIDLTAGSRIRINNAQDQFDSFGLGDDAATIRFTGPASINIADVGAQSLGGNFVVATRRGASLVANSSLGNATARFGTLSVSTDSIITIDPVNARIAFDGPLALEDHDLAIESPDSVTFAGPVAGSGRLITRGEVRFTGDVSGFHGAGSRIIVKRGMLEVTAGAFDSSPQGPVIRVETDALGQRGVFSVLAGEDISRKLDPESTGVLALQRENSTLSGVNGSYASIAAGGEVPATLLTPQLAPGAENTYRFGGAGANTPALLLGSSATPNQLTGDNHVMIGSGEVRFLAPNNYTGSTTIDGMLVLESPMSIGNGAATGPIQVNGTLLFAGSGNIGQTGPIEVNGTLGFRTTDGVTPQILVDTPIILRNKLLVDAAFAPTDVQATIGRLTIPSGRSTLDIDTTGMDARLQIGNLNRESGGTILLDWNEFGGIAREVTIGNGEELVVNGIIPWANFGTLERGFSLATYGPTGLTRYTGPFTADINAAGPTDNVKVESTTALTRNTSVNSIQGPIDLQGHMLNVGTTPVDGVATGRVAAGLGGTDPGFLTAGQVAFAPDSAFRGELIIDTGIGSAIIDNAGPDGIFGNGDDLPVAVVLTGGGLSNPNNRYTGRTTIVGSVTTRHPFPGTAVVKSGALSLLPEQTGSLMATAPLIFDAPGRLLQLQARVGSGASSSPSDEVRIDDLTVTPQTQLSISPLFSLPPGPQLVIEGETNIRGATISARLPISIRGTYRDDAKTLFADSARGPMRFENHLANDVAATLAQMGLEAEGPGTVIHFNGVMRDRPSLRASNAARVVVGGQSTLTARNGETLRLLGTTSGVIEFAESFQLIKSVRDIETDLIGAPEIELQEPVRWVTNHTRNLPNFSTEYMADEAPDTYPGRIKLAANGAVWQVRGQAQSFNQRLDIGASAHLVTDSPLFLTSESTLAFGRAPGFGQTYFTFALNKEGPADLEVAGRMVAFDQSIIDVREGRLLLNNRTAEGASQIDVRVRAGATLAGGNSAASTGLIPGVVTVDAGGTLDPGGDDATGVISIIGDFGALKLQPASLFEPTIEGAVTGALYDQIRVAGTIELGDGAATGAAVLAPALDYAPALGDLFFLIDNDGADPISGLFQTPAGTLLSEGAFFDLTSSADGLAYRFQIGYHGDTVGNLFSSPTGNDVVLRAVAIPEPASLGLLLAFSGIAAIAHIAGRRRKSCH